MISFRLMPVRPDRNVDVSQTVGGAPPLADDVHVFPATVGQLGFWYLDQLRPGDPVYNVPIPYRLKGLLDVGALEQALNEIVRRHEALRTTFATQDGVAVQVVWPRLKVPLPTEDLTVISAPDREAHCKAAIEIEGRKSFDLSKGPLIRARLFRLGDENHVLVLTYHHIIVDGWSLGLITDELALLYGAHVKGLESPLDEPSIQYADYAVWQREWLKCQVLDGQLAYWSKKLHGLPDFELPPDQSGLPEQASAGAIESQVLPEVVRAGLAALCRKEKASPFMVTLAAFEVILNRYTGKEDIVVGTVQAGRHRPELEPLVGLFINPLVLRTDMSGNPTFIELLSRVRETVLQAFANRDVPFGRVVDVAQPKRNPSRHPLFQINFLHQRAFLWPRSEAGLDLTPIPSLSTGSMFDLNFFIIERADGLRVACDYKTERYTAGKIQSMIEHFQTLLAAALADPTRRISDLPIGVSEAPSVRKNHLVHSTPDTRLQDSPTNPDHAPPRDPIQAQLAEIWERLLRSGPVSVKDDFFDLGGHSLLAMRLLAEVNKTFGKTISLGTLMASPTIEAMSAHVRSDKRSVRNETRLADETWEDPDTRVFPMRVEGSRPPLLLVDAGPFFRPLARALGSDQPVYGITLPKRSELPEQFTAKDLASNLVNALLQSTVREPYYLAGWCATGVIAYEMAQQLRALGKEVATLIVFDAYNPTYHHSFRTWKNYHKLVYLKFENALYHFRKLCGMSPANAWQYLRQRVPKQNVGMLLRIFRRSAGSAISHEPETTEVWRLQQPVALEYRPQPSDFPMTLVRSTARTKGLFRDPDMGWRALACGGFRVCEIPGEHDAMFLEPGVQRLAEVIAQQMRHPAKSLVSETQDRVSRLHEARR